MITVYFKNGRRRLYDYILIETSPHHNFFRLWNGCGNDFDCCYIAMDEVAEISFTS